MNMQIAGWSLLVAGLGAGTFSTYCLYRLWKYGPFNANLIFQIVDPFASWGSIALVSIGAGLVAGVWWVAIIAGLVYFVLFRIVQALFVIRWARRQQGS